MSSDELSPDQKAAMISDPRLVALLQHADEPFTWNTDLLTMMAIIGQVQLALRHPGNQGDQGKLATVFIRSVQQQLAKFDVRLSSLIEDGFDPGHDLKWEDAGGTVKEADVAGVIKVAIEAALHMSFVHVERGIYHAGTAEAVMRDVIEQLARFVPGFGGLFQQCPSTNEKGREE